MAIFVPYQLYMGFTELIRLSWLRPRKGVISMDFVGAFLGGLIVLAVITNELLKRAQKPSQKFPSCRTCGRHMVHVGLPNVLPLDVLRYLDAYRLPAVVVSRFICPKGDYQLWFIPKFGNTERAFFLREDM
jgi:hypothetical protein